MVCLHFLPPHLCSQDLMMMWLINSGFGDVPLHLFAFAMFNWFNYSHHAEGCGMGCLLVGIWTMAPELEGIYGQPGGLIGCPYSLHPKTGMLHFAEPWAQISGESSVHVALEWTLFLQPRTFGHGSEGRHASRHGPVAQPPTQLSLQCSLMRVPPEDAGCRDFVAELR